MFGFLILDPKKRIVSRSELIYSTKKEALKDGYRHMNDYMKASGFIVKSWTN